LVLFSLNTFRKIFYSQYASSYIEKIVKALVAVQSENVVEDIDDDLRGLSGLFVEKVGYYDGLSEIYKSPKTGTTVDYWCTDWPDVNDVCKGLWYFDHVNHNYALGVGYVKNMAYQDGRDMAIYNDPCVVNGSPLSLQWRSDYVPSIVSSFKRSQYGMIPDSSHFQVLTTDFSFLIVIYPRSEAVDQGTDSSFVSKTDNTTNGYLLRLGTDFKVRCQIKKGGTETLKASSTNLSLNAWTWVWVTWKSSTSTLKIYFNSTDVTTTSASTVTYNDSTTPDLYIGTRSISAAIKGLIDAGVYLFAFWRKELSSTEISNMFTNKTTIDNLTATQVSWTNYAVCQ